MNSAGVLVAGDGVEVGKDIAGNTIAVVRYIYWKLEAGSLKFSFAKLFHFR